MMQFDRVAVVDIGRAGESGLRLSSHRITFRVVKTDGGDANTLTIELYNLSRDSRAQIESTENKVVLSAGYSMDTVRVLAVGDVTSYHTDERGGNVVTTIEAGDGIRALTDTRVSISYDEGVSALSIVEDVAASLAVEAVDNLADLSGAYRNGYTFSGQAKHALDELAKRFDFDWSIQNGVLQLLPRREADTREIVVLTPETGMIGSPQTMDDTGANIGANQQAAGVTVTCQLQPRFVAGGVLELQSRGFNGAYRITEIEHSGDTRGQAWTTTIKARECEI